jgi:hypothetical protein
MSAPVNPLRRIAAPRRPRILDDAVDRLFSAKTDLSATARRLSLCVLIAHAGTIFGFTRGIRFVLDFCGCNQKYGASPEKAVKILEPKGSADFAKNY